MTSAEPQLCAGKDCPVATHFECQRGSGRWWLEWSTDKIQWCCQHMDCHLGSPAQENPEFSIVQAHKGGGPHARCVGTCSMGSARRTCREWISWTAYGVFRHQLQPCHLAFQRIRVQCPACAECTLDDAAGCLSA
ncbi:unnamed protein product [Effrenium voratum]|uniref:Uncharacterized protein n=1 Tax=Effrenium voratum TaxID=2562239 RepID=A0AA36N8Y3_9DINO|nr:unnamed protein product [Effrenium voratum]